MEDKPKEDKKGRPENYQEKLVVNGSFEQVVRAMFKKHAKNKKPTGENK